MAPGHSRVARESPGDSYSSQHDGWARGFWLALLPKELQRLWNVEGAKPPPWFDLEKCSLPLLEELRDSGLPIHPRYFLAKGEGKPDEGKVEEPANENKAEQPPAEDMATPLATIESDAASEASTIQMADSSGRCKFLNVFPGCTQQYLP